MQQKLHVQECYTATPRPQTCLHKPQKQYYYDTKYNMKFHEKITSHDQN